MNLGAPLGHLLGQNVDTGSLSRTKYSSLGSSLVTFGALAGIYLSFKSMIKDGVTAFLNVTSPLSIPNVASNQEARYAYRDDYIAITTLLDSSGGLLLNKITSDTTSSVGNALGSYSARGYFESRVGNPKGRFDQGKLPNGN